MLFLPWSTITDIENEIEIMYKNKKMWSSRECYDYVVYGLVKGW